MSELMFREASFESVGGSPLARVMAMAMLQQDTPALAVSKTNTVASQKNVGTQVSNAIGGRQ